MDASERLNYLNWCYYNNQGHLWYFLPKYKTTVVPKVIWEIDNRNGKDGVYKYIEINRGFTLNNPILKTYGFDQEVKAAASEADYTEVEGHMKLKFQIDWFKQEFAQATE